MSTMPSTIPQFANPATVFTAANFGQITATSVNPGILQFALSLTFSESGPT